MPIIASFFLFGLRAVAFSAMALFVAVITGGAVSVVFASRVTLVVVSVPVSVAASVTLVTLASVSDRVLVTL